MVLDRLYHDDGVVDHDADRQHEGEERYGIGRETERQHRRESTDERDRHGDQRNEGGPDAAEEEIHDDDDEREGLEQGLDDLVDALLDEDRRVVGDLVFDTLWERRPELLEETRICSALAMALPPGDW